MASEWARSTSYAIGEEVVPPTMGTKWYICTSAGQSSTVIPFDNANDAKGDVITDYQVKWLCMGDGGVGNIKFVYGSDKVIIPGGGSLIKWTYGNPNMALWKQGGSKNGPLSIVAWSGEEIFQISGFLLGPGTPAEVASLRSLFKTNFGDNTITMTLTGDWATMFGSGNITVMHSGSTALRISPVAGSRYMVMVDVQVIVVDNP